MLVENLRHDQRQRFGHQRRRALRVKLPSNLASHSTVQDFYFGDDFLMRRQDYTLDVAGGCNVANYALNFRAFDGLFIPTKRRRICATATPAFSTTDC